MGRIASFVVACSLAAPARAGFNDGFFFQAVPTLDEVGLATLIAAIGAVAGWAVRKRSGRK